MTDAGDLSDVETPPIPVTPPATPLRKQAFVADSHSMTRTAPPTMKSAGSGFPFNNNFNGPTSAKKARKHRRSPSEGIFNMSLSSDEDNFAGAGAATPGNALLEYARKRPQQKTPATPSPTFSRATTASTAIGGIQPLPASFFASSQFQNSPSPDELPDPSQFL